MRRSGKRPCIGTKVRSPDVEVSTGPLDQTTGTPTDAIAIFEVLSDDTATTDRVGKLIDYADLPSLLCYALLEQLPPTSAGGRPPRGRPGALVRTGAGPVRE